jgi:hypothetical protein
VHWAGWPTDTNTWEALENVEETEVFDVWEKSREVGGRSIFLEGEGARTVPFACGDGGLEDDRQLPREAGTLKKTMG